MTSAGGPRFLADVMLGRLARWLRFLGYDTAYDARADDPELAARARIEDRVLLTRDRPLLAERTVPKGLLVLSDDPMAQLRQVVRAYGLARRPPRCTRCNGALLDRTTTEIAGRVPPFVARTQAVFHECADCGWLYWEGTHVARMREKLAGTPEDLP